MKYFEKAVELLSSSYIEKFKFTHGRQPTLRQVNIYKAQVRRKLDAKNDDLYHKSVVVNGEIESIFIASRRKVNSRKHDVL